jgi:hypothetical protein
MKEGNFRLFTTIGGFFQSFLRVNALVLACFLLPAACNWGPEGDLEKKIDDEVAYANAADIDVHVEVSPLGAGTVQPAGTLRAKHNYAFPVEFVEGAGYAFIEWQAFEGRNGVPVDSVEFVNRYAPATEAVVRAVSNNFYIMPRVVERPSVLSTNLPPSTYERVPTNYPALIEFKNPIREETVSFETVGISGRGNYGRSEQVFDLVADNMLAGGTNALFHDPIVENRRFISLRLREGQSLPPYYNITITLKGEIADLAYPNVTMRQDVSFAYGVTDKKDEVPPQVDRIYAGYYGADGKFHSEITTAQAFSALVDTEKEYNTIPAVNGARVLYLLFNAFDNYGSIGNIRITERIIPAGGDPEPVTQKDFPALQWETLPPESGANLLPQEEYYQIYSIYPFYVAYTLSSAASGAVVELTIQPSDSGGVRAGVEDAHAAMSFLQVKIE